MKYDLNLQNLIIPTSSLFTHVPFLRQILLDDLGRLIYHALQFANPDWTKSRRLEKAIGLDFCRNVVEIYNSYLKSVD